MKITRDKESFKTFKIRITIEEIQLKKLTVQKDCEIAGSKNCLGISSRQKRNWEERKTITYKKFKWRIISFQNVFYQYKTKVGYGGIEGECRTEEDLLNNCMAMGRHTTHGHCDC